MLGKIRARWQSLSAAQRDLSLICSIGVTTWIGIQLSGICGFLFHWIAHHPAYPIGSFLIAYWITAFGVAVFARRRTREMRKANSARESAERDYENLAYNDPLTGLLNRHALREKLRKAHEKREAFGLILLDLDRFKIVNDLHGHGTGDRLLQLVAARISDTLVPGQTCFRLGGDEFAIIVQAASDTGLETERLARRLIRVISRPFEDGSHIHYIGASAGIALHPFDMEDTDELIHAADTALYRAKHGGRGQYRCFVSAMGEQIRWRAQTEQEMRIAVNEQEFVPYYQPIVSLPSGRIKGFELLARWIRPDGVEIGPDVFIPIAEECGLIGDILFSMLDRACKDSSNWDPGLSLAINISPIQLMDPWLSEHILAVLMRNAFNPKRLIVEITEDAIIADESNAGHVIESLKNQGIRISLDDFGTGYSSLHHLRVLPFDEIKIDRSFVRTLAEDRGEDKIIRAIIGLARSLKLEVIAEGIEFAAMAGLLSDLGCSQGQGYYFGAPMTSEEVVRMLAEQKPSIAIDPEFPEFDEGQRLRSA